MVDRQTTPDLAQRGYQQRSCGESENKDGHDECCRHVVRDAEVIHDLRHAWSHHRGGQGPANCQKPKYFTTCAYIKTYVRNAKTDKVAIIPHLRPVDQFNGFSGSCSAGSSHHTERLWSGSCSGLEAAVAPSRSLSDLAMFEGSGVCSSMTRVVGFEATRNGMELSEDGYRFDLITRF